MPSTARVAWICAAALAVFVAWIATDVSANAGVGFFYAVPIGLATWWFGWRAGAVALVGCCGLYGVGSLLQPVPHFETALAVRLSAYVGVVVLVSFSRRRLIALEHSADELEAIRAALTPPTLPEIAGVDFGAAFVPSELGVSGDFYLVTNGPDDSTVVVVGDVVGHGPKAAQLATFVRARLAALAGSTSDPAELLMLANAAIIESHPHDAIVSAVCLRFSARNSMLTWAIAGHPRPLLLPHLGALEAPGETMLLGVEEDLNLSSAESAVDAKGGVVVFTDGATDVRGEGGKMLGLDGLLRLLGPLVEMPAASLAQGAEESILDWAREPIRDDLCILALRPRSQ